MTKGQKNLIALLLSFLGFALFVFRKDLFSIPTRPEFSEFMINYGLNWAAAFSIGVFFYFLAIILKLKGYWGLIFIGIVELLLVMFLYQGPKVLPNSFKLTATSGFFRGVALANRPMIQFEENCSQYDSTAFYTLKPGKSSFKSYEFDNLFDVNSKGFRDLESDLKAPDILFLGDSYSMGWGVDQNANFQAIVESNTGKACLNTGISSYGTARELHNFKKVDKSKLEAIVLQFHDTDLEENDYYIKNKKLGNRTKEEFKSQVESNTALKKYYPLKFIKSTILELFKRLFAKTQETNPNVLSGAFVTYPNYDKDFYSILKEIRKDFKGPILITYVGSFYTTSYVIENLQKANTEPNNYFLNLSNCLNEKHYYFFDDHINTAGHKIVGEKISEKLKIILKK
jgi:hypothetical protein